MASNVKRYLMRFRQRVVERVLLEKSISELSTELGLQSGEDGESRSTPQFASEPNRKAD